MDNKRSTPLWTGTFFLLLFLNLFNFMAGQMTVPLVAKFSLTLDDDLTLASTVAGLMSLVSLFVCPFAGLLSDRIDRKKILLVSFVGYGGCLLLHAIATSVTMLIVLRLVTGIFFSVVTVTVVAYSTAFIPRERLGEGLGYTALAGILSQALGPGLGIALAGRFGYTVTFMVAGICPLLCAAVLIFMPGNTQPKSATRKKFSFHDLFAVEFTEFMLLATLFSSGSGLVSTYLAIIAEERALTNVALYFTVYSICMVALRPLTGKLLDKKGFYVILIPSLVFAASGMFCIGIGYTMALIVAASVCNALGHGSGTPSLSAYTVKSLGPHRAGVATSTVQIGQNVGNALAPICSSFFVKSYGFEKTFTGFGAILLASGMLILLVYFLRTRNKKPETAL